MTWTRDLEGVGNENTQFRVTYQHHIGGTKWGDDIRAVTERVQGVATTRAGR